MLAVATIGWCSAAQATAIFTLGNNPQPTEENLLLNYNITGATVFGQTQTSNITGSFSSSTDTLTEPSSGQARIEALDGLINDITNTVPGGSFTDFILNPSLEDRGLETRHFLALSQMSQWVAPHRLLSW
jgi:hypothetical protein